MVEIWMVEIWMVGILPGLAFNPLCQVVPDLDGEVLSIQHLHLAQCISLQLLGLNPARHGPSPRANRGLKRRLLQQRRDQPSHAHQRTTLRAGSPVPQTRFPVREERQ